jgi:hypothetical protein
MMNTILKKNLLMFSRCLSELCNNSDVAKPVASTIR